MSDQKGADENFIFRSGVLPEASHYRLGVKSELPQLLKEIAENLPVLIAEIRCLRSLQTTSDGKLLIVIGDKEKTNGKD